MYGLCTVQEKMCVALVQKLVFLRMYKYRYDLIFTYNYISILLYGSWIYNIPSSQEVFSTQMLGIHISGPGGAESLLKYLYLDPKDP